MKTLNDPNADCATKSDGIPAPCGKPAGSTGLKALFFIASVTAALLAYQAVKETFALHRWMDETAERIAAKPVMAHPSKNMPTHPGSKTSETNRLSAVLSN